MHESRRALHTVASFRINEIDVLFKKFGGVIGIQLVNVPLRSWRVVSAVCSKHMRSWNCGATGAVKLIFNMSGRWDVAGHSGEKGVIGFHFRQNGGVFAWSIVLRSRISAA